MANNIIQLSDGSGGVTRILNDYVISDVATLVDIFTELPLYHTLVCRVQPIVINTIIGDNSLSSSATCTITKNDTYIIDVLYTRVGSSVMGHCRYNFNTGVSSNNKRYPELGWQEILSEKKSYTHTASTWFKIDSTFTLQRRSLVLAIYAYESGAPLGIAFSGSTAQSMANANTEMSASGNGHTLRMLALLDNGTYAVWAKNALATSNNTIKVIKVAEI